MSEIAIRVDALSKRYRLGSKDSVTGVYRYKSLRDSLSSVARRPFGAMREALWRQPMNEQNSFWALQDINFEVKKGEVLGIIGRNGAGKSTLLKILSRITKPTTGGADLFGRVGSLLEVGTGFHPELTGRENIFLNAAILGMTRAEVRKKLDEIVAFSEIETFLDTPVKQYSTGMYMRLAFAVAANMDPEILIVDEVLAVGDIEFQRKCIGKMKDVARGGRTVLFVSHNMAAVGAMCTRGIVLSQGKISFSGDAADAAANYIRGLRSNVIDRVSRDQRGKSILSARVILGDDSQVQVEEPSFEPGDQVFIEFECRLPESSTLNIGMTVCSHDRDIPAISASIRDSGAVLPPGHQRVRVRLPIERLATGSYRIEAAAGDANGVYAQSDNLAFFHVVNTAHNKLGTIPRAGSLLGTEWEILPMNSDDAREMQEQSGGG